MRKIASPMPCLGTPIKHGKGIGVDHAFYSLNRNRNFAGAEFQPVLAARPQRRPSQPEQPAAKDVGLHRRIVHMADDLAALHEQLLIECNADRMARLRLQNRRLVPALDAGHLGRLVGWRE